MVPAVGGEQVPEPLVRRLVSDQPGGVGVTQATLAAQHGLGHRRGRDVLHPTEREVVDASLAVLRVRVAQAGLLAHEGQHGRRRRKTLSDVVGVLLLAEVHQRDAVPLVVHDREVARYERRQVDRVREVHAPVFGHRTRLLRAVDALAGGHRGPPFGQRHGQLGGRAIGRVVDAREPPVSILALALGEDLRRHAALQTAEPEALLRRAAIADLELFRGAALQGPREHDRELLSLLEVGEVVAGRVQHAVDLQPREVEGHARQRALGRHEAQLERPVDRTRDRVDGQLEGVVLRIDGRDRGRVRHQRRHVHVQDVSLAGGGAGREEEGRGQEAAAQAAKRGRAHVRFDQEESGGANLSVSMALSIRAGKARAISAASVYVGPPCRAPPSLPPAVWRWPASSWVAAEDRLPARGACS